jgi:cutinase
MKLPGKVACQGVGGGYKASLGDNGNPKGTSKSGTAEAVKMFQQAATKCPRSKIVFGGYRYVPFRKLMTGPNREANSQ